MSKKTKWRCVFCIHKLKHIEGLGKAIKRLIGTLLLMWSIQLIVVVGNRAACYEYTSFGASRQILTQAVDSVVTDLSMAHPLINTFTFAITDYNQSDMTVCKCAEDTSMYLPIRQYVLTFQCVRLLLSDLFGN